MRKACLVVSPPYTNGEIFNRANQRLNRDNCLAFFHCLQDSFRERGVDLNTQDIHNPEICELVIYNEMPAVLPKQTETIKSILLLFESELIRPDNWNRESHSAFSKIFTWHDEYVDNEHYFKMNFTYSGKTAFLPFENKEKFCTLIAGDKKITHPLELYSKRREAIRWFEKNHPEQFEFFGVGWDLFTFRGPKIFRVLNRLAFLRRFLAEKWPSYRGKVEAKLPTLSRYKFSICYENAQSIPGYITEKIFDSLAAGCIPVYWGAPNILDYVPEVCFVDRRKYTSLEELYAYLNAMTAAEYNKRQQAIQSYLEGTTHEQFMPKNQASHVVKTILEGAS